jgi:hypothetical protein
MQSWTTYLSDSTCRFASKGQIQVAAGQVSMVSEQRSMATSGRPEATKSRTRPSPAGAWGQGRGGVGHFTGRCLGA